MDLFVRDDDTSDGFREVDEHACVSDIVLDNCGCVTSDSGQVLFTVWPENWQSNNDVAEDKGTVLNEDGVIDAIEKSVIDDLLAVFDQLLEGVLDSCVLPSSAIIEADLLSMGEDVEMMASVLTLVGLSLSCHLAEGRCDELQEVSRDPIPRVHDDWPFNTNQAVESTTEKDQIEDRF